MYYSESKKILEVVKKANKLILLCHESPDLDSVISNLVMANVLESMGKNVEIISVDNIKLDYKFLESFREIRVLDPNKFDYSKYDTLIAVDVSDLKRLGIKGEINFKGNIVNIDHHEFSSFGNTNLINTEAGSTCTILYYLFKDWELKLKKGILDDLLAGIISDTGIFHFSIYSSSFIFRTVAEIIDSGGNYEKALYHVDQSKDLMVYKFLAEAINSTIIDKDNRFAYTTIPYEVFKKYEKFSVSSRQISDTFLRGINDTDFCIVLIGKKDGEVKVSIRSRTPNYYVIGLIRSLGGGGHLTGGGARVKEENFEKAVEKVLNAARKYAKENNTS